MEGVPFLLQGATVSLRVARGLAVQADGNPFVDNNDHPVR